MGSLLDRDETRKRETAYPDTAGHALAAIGSSAVQLHTTATEKYVDWVQELLKRDDVRYGIKMAILGGEDPMVFGGSIPAIMMAKLESLGVDTATISGSMTVSESNKATEGAKTSVESKTDVGIGTPFWHATENLTVRHSTDSNQTRSTDYRAKIAWSVTLKPQGEPEGVGLIKESVGRAFDLQQQINQAFVDAQAEKIKGSQQPAEPEDADSFLKETDIDGADGGADSGSGSDDAGTQTDGNEE